MEGRGAGRERAVLDLLAVAADVGPVGNDAVGAVGADDPVDAVVEALDQVVAGAAVERVGALAAHDPVVAVAPGEAVGAAVADQDVVARGADHVLGVDVVVLAVRAVARLAVEGHVDARGGAGVAGGVGAVAAHDSVVA